MTFISTDNSIQVDLPKNQPSGLLKSVDLVKDIEGISVIELNASDVVRHKLVKKILAAFEKAS